MEIIDIYVFHEHCVATGAKSNSLELVRFLNVVQFIFNNSNGIGGRKW